MADNRNGENNQADPYKYDCPRCGTDKHMVFEGNSDMTGNFRCSSCKTSCSCSIRVPKGTTFPQVLNRLRVKYRSIGFTFPAAQKTAI